jgi:glycosyltransferase involved in cell wall biosynthesis
MRRIVYVDQLAVTSGGSDRGLGRYASEVLKSAKKIESIDVKELVVDENRKLIRTSIFREINHFTNLKDVIYHSTMPSHLTTHIGTRQVCSIQDLIPLDLNGYTKFGLKTKFQFMHASRSSRIIVNSEFTADRVKARLDIPNSRIFSHLIPISETFLDCDIAPGLELKFPNSEYAGNYVLAMADMRTVDPRKRNHWISQLAEHLASLKINLVIMGRNLSSGKFPGAFLIENPSDDEMKYLYQNAICFFYPSAYEGQGLPPQEAISQFCPVISFDNSSLKEAIFENPFALPDPFPWAEFRLSQNLEKAHLATVISTITEIAGTSSVQRISLVSKSRDKIIECDSQTFSNFLKDVYENV